jgi:hypothetical protein
MSVKISRIKVVDISINYQLNSNLLKMALETLGITLVGLGNMGAVLAYAFLKSGRSLTV